MSSFLVRQKAGLLSHAEVSTRKKKHHLNSSVWNTNKGVGITHTGFSTNDPQIKSKPPSPLPVGYSKLMMLSSWWALGRADFWTLPLWKTMNFQTCLPFGFIVQINNKIGGYFKKSQFIIVLVGEVSWKLNSNKRLAWVIITFRWMPYTCPHLKKKIT